MGIQLKRQRDGTFRRFWYGEYKDGGKRKVVNLNVPWRGNPPTSLRDPGDGAFEKSREEAEKELQRHLDEIRHKGRAEHLMERLIESKTGQSLEHVKIQELGARWRSLGRERAVTEEYLKGCDARFRNFIEFMGTRTPPPVYLYEVASDDTAAFVAHIRKTFAGSTARATVRLLNKAFSRFLPMGAANPFEAFVGTRGRGKSDAIHRKPFTPEELTTLLDAAKHDGFMYPLIVTAACTGMRRGDVCNLKWSAVDLKAGMLRVKTSKTDAPVEIPIFDPLRAILEERKGNAKGHVFPDAARMLKRNRNGLSWRFKKIVAKAFAPEEAAHPPFQRHEIKSEAIAAVRRSVPKGERRLRMIETLNRYCSGDSYRRIAEDAGYAKATISADLHAVQDMIGKQFLPVKTQNIKHAIRKVSQVKRETGQRAASVRDWHALRATYVTLALTAGVPVELVRRVTGHATVEVVLTHYFRPDREQFRAALTNAMPGILTGGKRKRITPAEELTILAEKVAASNATKKDAERLKELAGAIR